MVAATKHKSQLVDNLNLRRIDAKTYEVESRSVTLGSHIVRKTYAGEWVCSRQCTAYNMNYRCSHVASVIRHERWLSDAYASMDKAVNALIANYEATASTPTTPPPVKRTLESLFEDA